MKCVICGGIAFVVIAYVVMTILLKLSRCIVDMIWRKMNDYVCTR